MPEVKHVLQDQGHLAGIRFVMKSRSQMIPLLSELTAAVPAGLVTGPPVLVLHYVSSEKEGILADLGLPVASPWGSGRISNTLLPRARCLSVTHRGAMSTLRDAYRELFAAAGDAGLVTDEYGVEVLHDAGDPENATVEVRLVVHPWEELLKDNLIRVLGEPLAGRVFGTCAELTDKTPLDRRFDLVKEALGRLNEEADDLRRYDCLSGCAHVFPAEQIGKLAAVFGKARKEGLSTMDSVDRVIEFMESDSGWSEKAVRQGSTVFTGKGPRDKAGYEKARTPEERAEAACFCPIIRRKLAEGMPPSFCYCGAGWYRQQWEGATGMPVRVEILGSLLNGDAECRFAVHLPERP